MSYKQKRIGILGGISHESTGKYYEKYNPDATILGCTELPLISDSANTDKTLLNPMDIHLNSVIEYISK